MVTPKTSPDGSGSRSRSPSTSRTLRSFLPWGSVSYPRAWVPPYGGRRRTMAVERRTSGLTYEDLQRFPADLFRREIIDGELLVTPAPGRRHQHAVGRLYHALVHY